MSFFRLSKNSAAAFYLDCRKSQKFLVIIQLRGTLSKINKITLIRRVLHETKESDRKKRRSAPANEILIVKVDHFSGYETCHTDVSTYLS